jgi:hypothetical protein
MDPITTLAITMLCSLWVAAWLNWLFVGEVRHLIVTFFPARMLAGVPKCDILLMTHDELLMFICGKSELPMFFRKLLTCPLCMSAHVSTVGVIFGLIAGLPLGSAPLVWAASAWVGYKLHSKLN